MGRKNKRRKPERKLWLHELEQKLTEKQDACYRCAYCGGELYPGEWHWMWDEFGQRVRKCNDERKCQRHRQPECEESYRKAMRM